MPRKNDIGMHSTHNEGKSVVAERFIRTLKNKIYKHMTAVSKNMYIDKLNDIGNKYNNTYHRIVKMKLEDIKVNVYIEFNKEVHNKDPKFKVCDHVRVSEYKNILYFDILQVGGKKFLWLKMFKILFHGHMLLVIFQKINKKNLG